MAYQPPGVVAIPYEFKSAILALIDALICETDAQRERDLARAAMAGREARDDEALIARLSDIRRRIT